MSRFIKYSMNLDTVKHSQDDLYFRTEKVYWKTSDQRLQVPFFMDITILMSWRIWGSRNALILESEVQNIRSVQESCKFYFFSNL